MNLIDEIWYGEARNEKAEKALDIIKNYLSQMALARGWTLDEFCSWLVDNYGNDIG